MRFLTCRRLVLLPEAHWSVVVLMSLSERLIGRSFTLPQAHRRIGLFGLFLSRFCKQSARVYDELCVSYFPKFDRKLYFSRAVLFFLLFFKCQCLVLALFT